MLDRDRIAADLTHFLGEDNVISDAIALRESSVDRYRKYQWIHGVYTRPAPAAVALVYNVKDVSGVLKYLNENKINCVPRTGASATEGGLETIVPDSVVLDGSGMNKILNFDPYNMQVTTQCGVCLDTLEEFLRERGFTTGHSPQSKPLAQMGGLVATRSIGQLSTLYGGIEDMVTGLEAVLPSGEVIRIKSVPRRAAGPDIRHIIIGSEGALCYITEVTVKIYKYTPENHIFMGYLIDDIHDGISVLRDVMVNGYKPPVARLYDIQDAEMNFSHFQTGKCVLIFITDGPRDISKATARAIEGYAMSRKAQPVDPELIKRWFSNLLWGPEKIQGEIEEIRQTNNMGFTTEISADWENIGKIYDACIKRVPDEIPDITLFGGHSSHSYINGTNMYFVYYYNVECGVTEEVSKYHDPINGIIVEEALRYSGSMVHHHGIGKARAMFTKQEHGSAYTLLEGLKKQFDPNGIMNKGTIYHSELY